MDKLVYDGFHKIQIVKSEIKGESVLRERVVFHSAVSALVTNHYDEMLLVKQYRPTINRYTWEIPAGICDKPLLSHHGIMLEELQEECNISPLDIDFKNSPHEPIHTYYMMTGSSDATMEIFKVNTTKEEQSYTVDDSEVEEVTFFTRVEISEMLNNKEIVDPKTLIAVLIYLGDE